MKLEIDWPRSKVERGQPESNVEMDQFRLKIKTVDLDKGQDGSTKTKGRDGSGRVEGQHRLNVKMDRLRSNVKTV